MSDHSSHFDSVSGTAINLGMHSVNEKGSLHYPKVLIVLLLFLLMFNLSLLFPSSYPRSLHWLERPRSSRARQARRKRRPNVKFSIKYMTWWISSRVITYISQLWLSSGHFIFFSIKHRRPFKFHSSILANFAFLRTLNKYLTIEPFENPDKTIHV